MDEVENSKCRQVTDVHKEELETAIVQRRMYWDDLAKKSNPNSHYPMPSQDDLVGLALSGGGIRSAMYNLGLLQAFEESGLMKHVDYMASVSGGGYTNGFYSLHHSELSERIACPEESDSEVHVPRLNTATNVTTVGPSTVASGDVKSNGSSKAQSHHKPRLAAGSLTIAHRSKNLAACTERFLLHGQYLNRPIEFLTSYMLRTFVMIAAIISAVVAGAVGIALIFRLFDEPRVRSWLGLLDLNTDLRVGLFSCAVLALVVLIVRALVLGFMRVRANAFRTTPGQQALIILGSFLLGTAIMIGNGDFAIAPAGGWLPESIDLKGLHWPIAILVLLMFSPLMRVSRLLQSERATATLGQKIALWLILCCTTWGAVFALVGWIGKENVSGFITNRPPTFVEGDIKDAGEFGKLMERQVGSNQGGELHDLVSREQFKNVDQDLAEIRQLTAQRREAERDLRPEQLKWSSWSELYNATFSRWIQVIGARIHPVESRVITYLDAEEDILQPVHRVTAGLDATLRFGLPTPDGSSEQVRVSATKMNLASLNQIASRLLQNVAVKIADFPKETSEVDVKAILDKLPPKAVGQTNTLTVALNDEVAMTIISAWIAKGGKTLIKGSARYRDLDSFQMLTEKAWLNSRSLDFSQFTELERWKLNRMCLEVAYPRVFKERAMISTPVVVREDQKFRMLIGFWALVIFLSCVLLIDLNWTCAWFHFYKNRVHATFLQGGTEKVVPLEALKPHRNGAPYPLFVAGMMLPQIPNYFDRHDISREEGNPSKLDGSYASEWYSFLFSPLYCGWLPCRRTQMATYLPTSQFWDKDVGVEDAVVLSGAAITPWMSSNTSLQFLMHLFNFRLEQWLPNPVLRQPSNRRFSMTNLAREFWVGRLAATADSPAQQCRYVVVADGGFREFLGVEELVARRCRIIIVSDAGCNNGICEFGVLADLIRKLRLDHGIQVLDLDHERPLDTRRLRRTEELENKSPQHFVLGRIRYPELEKSIDHDGVQQEYPKEALLVYVQMSLTGDEDIDIEQFRRTNPNFPDEPISNQFYTREQVESFRQLGEHIGRLLCRDISDFDCFGNKPQGALLSAVAHSHGSEKKSSKISMRDLQNERIRRLEDSFRFGYRNECRQEGFIAEDDARIGWILDMQVEGNTWASVHAYESDTNHRRQLTIRDYVWSVLDSVKIHEDFEDIHSADLYGMAVECNRRHAGFRPEWPTSYFQIGGRDLLIKAAQVAVEIFRTIHLDKQFASWCQGMHDETQRAPKPIQKLCRLAVMIPRGVFRKSGSRTSAELLVCMLSLVMYPNREFQEDETSLQWISSERAQEALRQAIRTGKAIEVEAVINKLAKSRNQEDAQPPTNPPPAATGASKKPR